MAPPTDIQRYRKNLMAERNAVSLYLLLAQCEENPALTALYRKLAEVEAKHEAFWTLKLQEAGAPVPKPSLTLRTRMLGFLAKRFGAKMVLPTIAGIERAAGGEYDGQADAMTAGLARDERSHAKIFGYLSHNTKMLDGGALARLEGRHKSAGGNALRAGVMGANDGLVSNFSLVMGVAGAVTANAAGSHTVLVTGIAGLLAGAISMALGEWLSVTSSRELYENQISIERSELAGDPEAEKEELTLIYQAKGMPAEDARRLAARLLDDPDKALDTLAREELGIDPAEMGGSAWEAALTSFFLFATGAILPMAPYIFAGGMTAFAWSVGLSVLGLFGIGAAITLFTGKNLLWSGVRMVFFGLAAAAVTFGIGHLIGAHLGG